MGRLSSVEVAVWRGGWGACCAAAGGGGGGGGPGGGGVEKNTATMSSRVVVEGRVMIFHMALMASPRRRPCTRTGVAVVGALGRGGGRAAEVR